MRSGSYKIIFLGLCLLQTMVSFSQDVSHNLPAGYDPDRDKIIPDKILEIGLPLLVLYLLANSIVSVFKIRAEERLKEKALSRELSESTLVALFGHDKNIVRYGYLKWFLILASLGLSLLLLHFIVQVSGIRSPYLGMGIITLFLSLAFYIYYRIIWDK
jgi:hypothetical protein